MNRDLLTPQSSLLVLSYMSFVNIFCSIYVAHIHYVKSFSQVLFITYLLHTRGKGLKWLTQKYMSNKTVII